MPSFGLSNARAEASRKDGARSRGPKTPNGKAHSGRDLLACVGRVPAAPFGGRTDSHDRMDHPTSWTDGVNKASTRASRWSRPGRP